MKKISDFNNATEKYPVIYAGSATRPEYVDMPTILQQQEGVAPLDTCPAQWWNAMWKLATRDINAFRDYVGDAFTEINNLLTKFNITLDDADSEQLYDFFHDDYVQNYLSSIFVNKSGDTIDGDLHIKGDLSVDGVGEEIISTELKVGANTITLRNGNPTGLGNIELAGVVTENYDGNNNNNIIAIDKNGVARTGDIDVTTRILYSNDGVNFYLDEALTNAATIGATEEVRDTGNQTTGGVEIYEGIIYSNDNTQALATRENTPLNGGYAVWNGTLKRFDTVPQGQNKSSFTIFVPGGDEVALSGPLTKNVTVAGITALSDGMSVQVMFTSAIQSTNSITQLNLNINSLGDVPIKTPSNNTLKYFESHLISSGGGFDPTYPNRLCDAWISLDLVYSASETAWIVVGNPIVMSCPNYTIYANGYNTTHELIWDGSNWTPSGSSEEQLNFTHEISENSILLIEIKPYIGSPIDELVTFTVPLSSLIHGDAFKFTGRRISGSSGSYVWSDWGWKLRVCTTTYIQRGSGISQQYDDSSWGVPYRIWLVK